MHWPKSILEYAHGSYCITDSLSFSKSLHFSVLPVKTIQASLAAVTSTVKLKTKDNLHLEMILYTVAILFSAYF